LQTPKSELLASLERLASLEPIGYIKTCDDD
jgi:hypothetical protein